MKLPAGWYNFYYHDVSDDARVPISVRTSPDRFASEIAFIARHFEVIPFAEGIQRIREGTHDAPRASLSFDDGFRSILDHALPVLKAHDMPHIIFLNAAFLSGDGASDSVLASYLGKGTQLRDAMHPDRFPDLWDQLKDAADWSSLFLDWQALDEFPDHLTRFGNHTSNHYWMAGLSRDTQLHEVRDNHERLRALPGYESFLALPFGTSSCFDDATLSVIDEVHGDVVIKAVGGIDHRFENGRWIVERMGLSNEKPRIDDVLRDRVVGRDLGYRLRKLGRKLQRLSGTA